MKTHPPVSDPVLVASPMMAYTARVALTILHRYHQELLGWSRNQYMKTENWPFIQALRVASTSGRDFIGQLRVGQPPVAVATP